MTLSKEKQRAREREKRVKAQMKAQMEGFVTADRGDYIKRVLEDSHSRVVRDARLVQVLRVDTTEGLGTAEGLFTEENPYRQVVYWYEADGTLIARRDRWEERDTSNLVAPEGS